MSAEEEQAILLQMKLQEGRPELTCRFKWEAGSIAMWCGTRPLSLFVPSLSWQITSFSIWKQTSGNVALFWLLQGQSLCAALSVGGLLAPSAANGTANDPRP